MKLINMKVYYPDKYKKDHYVCVDDIHFDELERLKRKDASRSRKDRRNLSRLSLESAINWLASPSLEVAYEQREKKKVLFSLIKRLPKAQSRRILKHFYFGLSYRDIAKSEGVSYDSVKECVHSGILSLRTYISKSRKVSLQKCKKQ